MKYIVATENIIENGIINTNILTSKEEVEETLQFKKQLFPNREYKVYELKKITL